MAGAESATPVDATAAASELRAVEARRHAQEEADAARPRDAAAAAARQATRDAAVTAAAARRQLQDDVARHERALAEAQRRLQKAAAAEGTADDTNDDAGADDAGPDDAAASVSALHAQALAILNVRALVPITLDLATPSFSKWRRLLLLALGKFALADHVMCDAAFRTLMQGTLVGN
jgi:hypothetical protein